MRCVLKLPSISASIGGWPPTLYSSDGCSSTPPGPWNTKSTCSQFSGRSQRGRGSNAGQAMCPGDVWLVCSSARATLIALQSVTPAADMVQPRHSACETVSSSSQLHPGPITAN